MFDAIVAGLVLAAVTGLCLVAYNHPTKFKPLGNLLLLLSAAAYATGFILMMLIGSIQVYVLEALTAEGQGDAVPVVASVFEEVLPDPLWIVLGIPLIIAFLAVLRFWVTTLKPESASA